MAGGAGADTFNTFADAGLDVVTDFNAADGDRVLISGKGDYEIYQLDVGVMIDWGSGGQMLLQNVQLADLGDGWLTFGG